MTIPPVGSSSGPVPSPDDRANKNESESRKPNQVEPGMKTPEASSERVEISTGSEAVRRLQADITRLQVAERAANEFENEIRELDNLFEKQIDYFRNRDNSRAETNRQQIEQKIRDIESRRNTAPYESEDLFDGRELRIRSSKGEKSMQMPDREREAAELAREARNAAAENRRAETKEQVERIRRIRAETGEIRERLEKDVREAIAGSMKESSASRPRDAAEAERLINRARELRKDESDRSGGSGGISQNAIDLLR